MRVPYECSDQDGLVREKWSVSCLIKHSLCEQPRHLQDFPTGQVFGVRLYTKLSIDSVRFESTTMLIISEVYTISVLIVRLFITPTCATKINGFHLFWRMAKLVWTWLASLCTAPHFANDDTVAFSKKFKQVGQNGSWICHKTTSRSSWNTRHTCSCVRAVLTGARQKYMTLQLSQITYQVALEFGSGGHDAGTSRG